MAKLGSFFRRLFAPLYLDHEHSTSDSCKSDVPILSSPSSSKCSTAESSTIDTRPLTSTSIPSSPLAIIQHKKTSSPDRMDEISKSNYLSSDPPRSNIRRLSAPLLIQTSLHPHLQYPSTIVNESTEEALLSSLHRASFSSTSNTTKTCSNSSAQSLATRNSGGDSSSLSLLSRPEIRSASFNAPTSSISITCSQVNKTLSSSGRWKKKKTIFSFSVYSRLSTELFSSIKEHAQTNVLYDFLNFLSSM